MVGEKHVHWSSDERRRNMTADLNCSFIIKYLTIIVLDLVNMAILFKWYYYYHIGMGRLQIEVES